MRLISIVLALVLCAFTATAVEKYPSTGNSGGGGGGNGAHVSVLHSWVEWSQTANRFDCMYSDTFDSGRLSGCAHSGTTSQRANQRMIPFVNGFPITFQTYECWVHEWTAATGTLYVEGYEINSSTSRIMSDVAIVLPGGTTQRTVISGTFAGEVETIGQGGFVGFRNNGTRSNADQSVLGMSCAITFSEEPGISHSGSLTGSFWHVVADNEWALAAKDNHCATATRGGNDASNCLSSPTRGQLLFPIMPGQPLNLLRTICVPGPAFDPPQTVTTNHTDWSAGAVVNFDLIEVNADGTASRVLAADFISLPQSWPALNAPIVWTGPVTTTYNGGGIYMQKSSTSTNSSNSNGYTAMQCRTLYSM